MRTGEDGGTHRSFRTFIVTIVFISKGWMRKDLGWISRLEEFGAASHVGFHRPLVSHRMLILESKWFCGG
jgi:hypothetical protein